MDAVLRVSRKTREHACSQSCHRWKSLSKL